MSEKPSFLSELKRRNVYKVAVAYAVVAWLLIQIATQVFPFFDIPNWGIRLVVLLLRAHPRFKTLVEGPEPKAIYN